MKNNKHLYIILTFLTAVMTLHISAAEIHLLDGRILHGRIVGVTAAQILMNMKSDNISVKQNDIDAVLDSAESDTKTDITIKYKSGSTEQGELVLLTHDILIFKTRSDINNLHEVSRSKIADIIVNNAPNVDKSARQQITLIDTSDILKATAILLDNSSNEIVIDSIENSDFYDKYWLKFNGRVDKTTGNLLWNLIDIYTDKEKNLTLIYNELLSNDKDKTEIKMSTISQELQSRIRQLRLEFARRAYRIMNNLQ